MKEFTSFEIGWIVEAIKMAQSYYEKIENDSESSMERSLAHLRKEQLARCEEKMRSALADGDKRIAIK